MAQTQELWQAPENNRPVDFLVFGGGSSKRLLAALLHGFPHATIAAGITTADSGGSTGWFRRRYPHFAASGDITGAIGAVSSDPRLAEMLDHRFGTTEGMDDAVRLSEAVKDRVARRLASEHATKVQQGMVAMAEELPQVATHTARNILFNSLLLEYCGDVQMATQAYSRILGARAVVYASSLQPHHVRLTDQSGGQNRVITGEDEVDRHTINEAKRARVSLISLSGGIPQANPAIIRAIHRTRGAIVVSPGSLPTSTVPSMQPEGIPKEIEAFRRRGGTVLYIANLAIDEKMPDVRSVDNLASWIGANAVEPSLVYYNTGGLDNEAQARPLIQPPRADHGLSIITVGVDMLCSEQVAPDKNDPTPRSLYHTDFAAVTQLMAQHGLAQAA